MAGVIYEVNLDLEREIADQYIAWLKPHIQEIINLPGFVSAELMAREEEKADPGKVYYTVCYRLQDRALLEDYFTKHAKTMRSSALELFGTRFSINRRVMSVTDTFRSQH